MDSFTGNTPEPLPAGPVDDFGDVADHLSLQRVNPPVLVSSPW